MELIDIDDDMQPSKVFVGRLIQPQTEEISDRGVPDTILVASAFFADAIRIFATMFEKNRNQCPEKNDS